MVRAFGFAPYHPENHAALIAAARRAGPYIARATAEGFSQFVSSAMRTDIGALLAGTSPLTDAHGIAGPPRPDVVIYSTNTGHELVRWFEFYGSHYGVPVMGLHPPPALNVLEQMDVDAAVHQLMRMQQRLEETHRTRPRHGPARRDRSAARPGRPSCGTTSSASRARCRLRSRSSTR